MFFLNEQNCKLSSVNLRSEFNGPDETRSACDLKIEAKMSNDILALFDRNLKAALYVKDNEDQGELIDAPDHLTKLRFPLLDNVMKWTEEIGESTVIVNYGIGGPSDIKLTECNLKKFVFDCQEGGTVHLSFSVQAHPTPENVGKLATLIQQEVKITVRPPNDAEKSETAERAAARVKLNDLFQGGEGDGEGVEQTNPPGDDDDPFKGSDLEGTTQYSEGPDEEPGDEIVDADEAQYNAAVAFAKTLERVSISKVKRELKITDLVAARLLQRMEDDGIVAEANGQGLREVLKAA